MLSNWIKFALVIISLIVCQTLTNNLSIFYVDLIASVMVVLLLNGSYSYLQIITLSLIADLFGHWYFGTHLVAFTILTFFNHKLINFYRIITLCQKIFLVDLFFIGFWCLIILIEIITKRIHMGLINLLIELVISCPIIVIIMHQLIIQQPSGFIFND